MFESLGFLPLLFLSGLLFFLSFIVSGGPVSIKMSFLYVIPFLFFKLLLQKPLTNCLANLNQATTDESSLMIEPLKFLYSNPIVSVIFFLLAFFMAWYGYDRTKSNQFKLIAFLLGCIVLSFLFPLILSGLIPVVWGKCLGIALLVQFILIYLWKLHRGSY